MGGTVFPGGCGGGLCPCSPALAVLSACLCFVLAWAVACVGRTTPAWADGMGGAASRCSGGRCLCTPALAL
eukprot:2269323-Alexandrium_andersonii.AAC.1